MTDAEFMAYSALSIEHEAQRLLLERLGIEWTPGEPFYSLIEDHINKLRQSRQQTWSAGFEAGSGYPNAIVISDKPINHPGIPVCPHGWDDSDDCPDCRH